MLSPNSDLAILLMAMGRYQDLFRKQRPDDANRPTPVMQDWEYHERETGFDREQISRLLPQLVAMGLAFDYSSHSKRGGNPSGHRPTDGYAWISDMGQVELSQMRQPPPPLQVMISELGPLAELQLTRLLGQVAETGVSKNDIRRLEDLLKDVIDGSEESKLEKAANVVGLLQGSKELAAFFLISVLPFLHAVIPK